MKTPYMKSPFAHLNDIFTLSVKFNTYLWLSFYDPTLHITCCQSVTETREKRAVERWVLLVRDEMIFLLLLILTTSPTRGTSYYQRLIDNYVLDLQDGKCCPVRTACKINTRIIKIGEVWNDQKQCKKCVERDGEAFIITCDLPG